MHIYDIERALPSVMSTREHSDYQERNPGGWGRDMNYRRINRVWLESIYEGRSLADRRFRRHYPGSAVCALRVFNFP